MMWPFVFLAMSPFWQWWAMFAFLARFYYREEQSPISYVELTIGFLCFHFASYYWIGLPLAEKLGVNMMLGLLPGLIAAAIHTLLFLFCINLRRTFLNKYIPSLLSWPCLWLLFEYLKEHALGGFPWCGIALTQIDAFFAPALFSMMGPIGVTFIVCLVSALLAKKHMQKMALVILMGMSYALITGANQSSPDVSPGKTVTFRTYQLLANQYQGHQYEYLLGLFRNAQMQPHNTISVFPEGIISLKENLLRYFEEDPGFLGPFFNKQGVVVFGANVKDNAKHIYNTAQVLSADHQPVTYYKQHLVPFGESVPFPLKFIQKWHTNLYSEGLKSDVIDLPNISISMAICYDIFFSDFFLRRPSNVVIHLLDDHWANWSMLRELQFRQTKVLALTLQVPVISSSSDGISGIVDQTGHTFAMKKHDIGFLSQEITLPSLTTQNSIKIMIYLRDYLAILILLIYPLFAVGNRWGKRVRKLQSFRNWFSLPAGQ